MLSSEHHAHIARATQGDGEDTQLASQRGTWFDAARDALQVTANLISCEQTYSLFRGIRGDLGLGSGASKLGSKGSVDTRGRCSAEITLTRRNLFLSGTESVGFSVPSVDDVASTLCTQATHMSEAPFSGTWRGKYFDGFSWQAADFTFFFQDLIGRNTTGAKNCVSGGSSLDVMGSCGAHSTLGCVAVSGNYNPDTGRVAWSQPAPPGSKGDAVWEVWAQAYASSVGGERGQCVDRMFASFQDSEGRRGNMELVLCEGSIPPFAVGNSYWSHTGLDLFVHEAPRPAAPLPPAPAGMPPLRFEKSAPVTLPPGWALPPGHCPVALSVVPAEKHDRSTAEAVAHGKGARAAASLGDTVRGGSVLEDPSHTLV
uniref:Uncharacterized protein n=1 Tax=Hemiselmis andersenii TaxID=464988 RepID=A0A6U2G9B7_HEMAN|mmetsp:Transcript_36196/g.84813  ORF Transcript_36196/g.84813 Transcript_36196/m.84813 type:complete len:371 (+) Transcript_36196:49-1161(+)